MRDSLNRLATGGVDVGNDRRDRGLRRCPVSHGTLSIERRPGLEEDDGARIGFSCEVAQVGEGIPYSASGRLWIAVFHGNWFSFENYHCRWLGPRGNKLLVGSLYGYSQIGA